MILISHYFDKSSLPNDTSIKQIPKNLVLHLSCIESKY